jgi:putative ABC transport system substrate-binding protein
VGTKALADLFRQSYLDEMRSLGWIDGQTAQFIVRYDEDGSRRSAIAAELVALAVDVIVVSDPALPAARKATSTIPIVALDMYDPIAEGVTASLARPGGNVTGVSWQSVDTAGKRLELAKALVPALRRVAVIHEIGDPGAAVEVEGLRAAATRMGVAIRAFPLRDAAGFPAAFAAIKSDRPDVLIVSVNALTLQHFDAIAAFAASVQVASISEVEDFAYAGGLLTYGAQPNEMYKRGARQVNRILKGAKPADLPFEQPTKFDLVINMKTAKALALSVPEEVMVRATKVIR